MKYRFSDVSKIDNGKYNAFEMDNRWFNTMKGVVRFKKTQITSV